jgi:hypothetical protein
MEITEVRRQEQSHADLPLSKLYEWQRVLEVPVTELLVEADDPLSTPVLKRAQLIRVMKTALVLRQKANRAGIRRLAQTLVDQLVEIMPELASVAPWPAVAKQCHDGNGMAVQHRLSEDVFLDLVD